MKHYKLEQALAQWQSWGMGLSEAPQLVCQLKQGLTNQSYVIDSELGELKLRLNSPISTALGINREHEKTIVDWVAEKSITPKRLFSEKNHRYTIFEFIDGEVWTDKHILDTQNQELIFGLIQAYQVLTPNTPARDYLAYFEQYEKQIPTQSLSKTEWSKYFDFKETLTEWQHTYDSKVLCHHDLIPQNIVEKDGLLCILDWEYAALGCGDLDYLRAGCDEKIRNVFSRDLHYWLNTLWSKINNQN